MSEPFSPLILPTGDTRGLQSSLLTVIDALNVLTPRLGAVEDILAAAGLATRRIGAIPMTWLGVWTASFVYLHGDVTLHGLLLMIANKTTSETPSLTANDWDLVCICATIPLGGGLAVTEAFDTLAATGEVLVQGDFAVTEAVDVLAAAGEVADDILPVFETFSLVSHGSSILDILAIDGVAVSEFNIVTLVCRSITQTGGPPNRIALRLSVDGGSSYLAGAADYIRSGFDGSIISGTDDDLMRVSDSDSFANHMCILYNLNALMPTSMVAQQMDVGDSDPQRRHGMTKSSVLVHDAIRYFIESSGSPVFTGGTVDAVGYR